MFAVSEIISKYDWTVTILARFHPRNSYFFFDKLNSIIVYEYISNCETVFLINKFLFLTRSVIYYYYYYHPQRLSDLLLSYPSYFDHVETSKLITNSY